MIKNKLKVNTYYEAKPCRYKEKIYIFFYRILTSSIKLHIDIKYLSYKYYKSKSKKFNIIYIYIIYL